MTTITKDEMQREAAKVLDRVREGETFLVMDADRPIAEISPVGASQPGPRPFGLAAGEFTVPDDFDAPLPDDVLDLFAAP